MMQKDKASLIRYVVLGVLGTLVLINIVWFFISKHPGSFWGFFTYLFILFLCIRQNDFRAGVVVGILGFGLHIYELAVTDIESLPLFDSLFFCSNLILPILLIYSSYRAYKLSK
jgi:hypothetical protein